MPEEETPRAISVDDADERLAEERLVKILRDHGGPAMAAELRTAAGMLLPQLRPLLDRLVRATSK